MIKTDYDILIVGGGMVGASLATALLSMKWRVALIEAVELASDRQPSYDDRTVALSFGSKRIYDTLGIWARLETRGATPIHSIHISNRGHFGLARLNRSDAAVEALGWVVENRALGQALTRALSESANLDYLCPATMEQLELHSDHAWVRVRCGDSIRELTARLVVAADGGRSALRQQAGISVQRSDYGQSALATNVTAEFPHRNVAYERFTPDGPLALLPMSDGRCAVVWTLRPQGLEAAMAMNDGDFLSALQGQFGMRLGRFTRAGRRAAYPLAYTRAAEPDRPRLVLIGNAAHVVHPVAGQGFNLGLRDVAVLAELLAAAERAGSDPGDADLIRSFSRLRRRDVDTISTFTNGLINIFSNESWALSAARNLALVAVDQTAPAKRALLRLSMGLSGRLPRLARGLPL